MTNEERLGILRDIENRAWRRLGGKTISVADIKSELEHINYLHWFADGLAGRAAALDDGSTETPVSEPVILPGQLSFDDAETTEWVKDEAPVVEPNPEPIPVEEPAAPSASDTYDKKEVIEMMKAARKQGINVSAIIRAFGVDNFGDIDAEKYPEVVAQLKKEGAV